MHCPHCGRDIPDSILRAYVSSQNGKVAYGKKKARSSEQMRAAARIRWNRQKRKSQANQP